MHTAALTLAQLYALVLSFRLKREIAHEEAHPHAAPTAAPSYQYSSHPAAAASMHSGSPYTASGYPPPPTEKTRLV